MRRQLHLVTVCTLLGLMTLCAAGLSQVEEPDSSYLDNLLASVEISAGIEVGSQASGIGSRLWAFERYGAELAVGGVVVPVQASIRCLYSPLVSDKAKLYVGPGISWKSGGLFPYAIVGSEWAINSRLLLNVFGGVGYTGRGTWLPPGPVLSLSTHLYSFFGISVQYRLPLELAFLTTEPLVQTPSITAP